MTWMMAAIAVSLGLSGAGDQASPPPPPSPVLVHGNVYFGPGSAQRLPPQTIDVIAHLVPKVPADAFVFVHGYTDTVGDADANQDLALRRARSVADALVAMGVRPGQISLISCGERHLMIPTPDNTAQPLNRIAVFDWANTRPRTPEGCSSQVY